MRRARTRLNGTLRAGSAEPAAKQQPLQMQHLCPSIAPRRHVIAAHLEHVGVVEVWQQHGGGLPQMSLLALAAALAADGHVEPGVAVQPVLVSREHGCGGERMRVAGEVQHGATVGAQRDVIQAQDCIMHGAHVDADPPHQPRHGRHIHGSLRHAAFVPALMQVSRAACTHTWEPWPMCWCPACVRRCIQRQC